MLERRHFLNLGRKESRKWTLRLRRGQKKADSENLRYRPVTDVLHRRGIEARKHCQKWIGFSTGKRCEDEV